MCIRRYPGGSDNIQPVCIQSEVLDMMSWIQWELSYQQLPNLSSSISPFIPIIFLLPALPWVLCRAVRPQERAQNSFIWSSAWEISATNDLPLRTYQAVFKKNWWLNGTHVIRTSALDSFCPHILNFQIWAEFISTSGTHVIVQSSLKFPTWRRFSLMPCSEQ